MEILIFPFSNQIKCVRKQENLCLTFEITFLLCFYFSCILHYSNLFGQYKHVDGTSVSFLFSLTLTIGQYILVLFFSTYAFHVIHRRYAICWVFKETLGCWWITMFEFEMETFQVIRVSFLSIVNWGNGFGYLVDMIVKWEPVLEYYNNSQKCISFSSSAWH